ncbi:MAG TPA: cadmium resistance transporter, partial [Chryseolinea sp.]|nr:cadmium resistance transporter [Chryseolinea sp.]
ILTLFYGNKTFKDGEILGGQLLGISSLITVSLIGSLAGLFIDPAYIGLLGLIPIYLGARGILGLINAKTKSEQPDNHPKGKGKNHVMTVAGVTFANGGDNIGIYTPLFAALTWTNKITMITIFLVMTFLWCLAAKYLTKHPFVAKAVDKYGHLVTPFVLVLLGLYILYESGTLGLLTE